MVTVLREAGLRVVIFVDDHAPAHVHVFGDGEAKVQLRGADGEPVLVRTQGMNRAEARRALRVVRASRDFLASRWEAIHGRAD